mgnify:CR=1 FL=1
MTKTEGFYFNDGEDIIGLITYIVYDNILEITSLDSLHEKQGIGSKPLFEKLFLLRKTESILYTFFYH